MAIIGNSIPMAPRHLRKEIDMKKPLAMAVLVVATQVGIAQTLTKKPATATATNTAKVTATVTAIDPTNRTVTLKGSKGNVVELAVGDDVRNFEQIKVGDVVVAEYTKAMSLTLTKKGVTSASQQASMSRSAAGVKPGGAVGREVTVIADVVAVDPKAQTVRLKGPGGNMVDVLVDNPEILARVHKGDHVEAVYKEAVAISVEPAAAKK